MSRGASFVIIGVSLLAVVYFLGHLAVYLGQIAAGAGL